MTQILLIRHAVNDVMKSKKLAGRMSGVHLNEEGQQQAEALAERLRDLPITAIYSSPLERTSETAAPLAAALNLDVIPRSGLLEVEYGEWTDRSLDELSKLEIWRVVQIYPSGMRFPGGETMRGMQARVVDELEWIANQHPRAVVAVFSHADVIKAALAHCLGIHLDQFQRISIDPVSVSVIALSQFGPRVVRVNDNGPLKLEPEKEPAAETPQIGGVAAEPAMDGQNGALAAAPAGDAPSDPSA